MRDSDSNSGLTGLAVAGSYVVLLGWDMAETDIKANAVLDLASNAGGIPMAKSSG
ncbi:MAG: hypothetical protein U1E63_03845 [Burkholderiales bacterium]